MKSYSLNWKFLIVNAISSSRIMLSPGALFLAFLSEKPLRNASLLIIIVMFASDILDGWLARRWSVCSNLGYILDGLGDRASYMTCVLIIVVANDLPILFAYLSFFRDLSLYAYRAFDNNWPDAINKTRFWTKSYAFFFKVILILGLLQTYSYLVGSVIRYLNIFFVNIIYIWSMFLLYSYLSLIIILYSYVTLEKNKFGRTLLVIALIAGTIRFEYGQVFIDYA